MEKLFPNPLDFFFSSFYNNKVYEKDTDEEY